MTDKSTATSRSLNDEVIAMVRRLRGWSDFGSSEWRIDCGKAADLLERLAIGIGLPDANAGTRSETRFDFNASSTNAKKYAVPTGVQSAARLTDIALAAIDAEPELPGEMPDAMWEAIQGDRDAMQEAMRIAVRQTKEGIRARYLAARPHEGAAMSWIAWGYGIATGMLLLFAIEQGIQLTMRCGL